MKTLRPIPLTTSLLLTALTGAPMLRAADTAPGPDAPRPPAPPRAPASAAPARTGETGGWPVPRLPVLPVQALPEPPEPPQALPVFSDFPDVVQWLGGESRDPVARTLIVTAEETSESKLAELREDLAVFSRILGKAAGEERRRGRDMALGIVVSTFPTLRRPEALYLEGYGAVLLLSVPFPLAAPTAEKDEPTPNPPADSLWERTRRELFGGQPGGPPPPDPFRGEFWERLVPDAKAAPYDASRVEKLRRDLTEALQHGTHLRHVKPEEYLVVAVTGTGAAPRREVRVERRLGRAGATETRREQVVSSTATPGAETLVLRVKKAEADALAAGRISLEEFCQRVSVRLY